MLLISSTYTTCFDRTDRLQTLNFRYLKLKIIIFNVYFKCRLNICLKTQNKNAFLFCFLNNMYEYLMPDDGVYDRNTQHVLTELTAFVVVDGNTYINF